MEPLKIFAALLALAVLAAAPGAGAPASSGEVDPVLFRRSCLDCPESHFCEYGFPGAPEGAVACVVGGRDKQLLYRRYEAADPPPAPNPRCLNNAAYFQCGPGAEWARGCDASSGDLATPGAASATGMCIPTNGVNTQYFCCQPVGQSNGACGDTYGGTHGRYRCFANANKDAALFQADGVAPRCMFDTGQVVASGGDGYCQVNWYVANVACVNRTTGTDCSNNWPGMDEQYLPDKAGFAAGCCVLDNPPSPACPARGNFLAGSPMYLDWVCTGSSDTVGRGCDPVTGEVAPVGASSARGMCVFGCCAKHGSAYFSFGGQVCKNYKYCRTADFSFALYTERNNTNGQGIKRSCDLARTGLVDTGNDVCSSDPTDSNVYASYGGLVPLKGYVAACCSPKPA